jgi:hypothetical protein
MKTSKSSNDTEISESQSIENEAKFLRKWAKGQPISSVGGSKFYMAGRNRNRCTMLERSTIDELIKAGMATGSVSQFKMVA